MDINPTKLAVLSSWMVKTAIDSPDPHGTGSHEHGTSLLLMKTAGTGGGRDHAEVGEGAYHRVAHWALARREDHHGLLRY
jgi:hypothetical protein